MLKLLLVDDDSEWLELLRLHFIDSGFRVIIAHCGIEALHLARKTAPDLMLLDLLLPDLDGMSICEILRKDPATAALPIILLTGVGGQIARLAAFDAGASDFVTKPIRPSDLVQRAFALLQSRKEKMRTAPLAGEPA